MSQPLQMCLIKGPPPFVVELHPRAPISENRAWRVQRVALFALRLLENSFLALGSATWITLKNAWPSFKQIVLGYYGSLTNFHPPKDLYLAVFKVFFWVANLIWGVCSTTLYELYQRMKDREVETRFLQNYCGEEIDVTHIQTRELEIDVSAINATIQVRNLLAIFDDIPQGQNQPGYVSFAGARKSRNALRKDLETFVERVEQRTPFLGTPPAHDTNRLYKFYQQIEDALRFCLGKTAKELTDFRGRNGEGPYEDVLLREEYNSLRETQSQMALTLAVAGDFCGARYMGETMQFYSTLNPVALSQEGSLRDSLVELLGQKRVEIANRQIAQHLGADAHNYSGYMASMGDILALPGTKNVVEQLKAPLDKGHYTELFFREYTVNFIIEAVQEAIIDEKNGSLRAKIIDWIKDRRANWLPHRSEEERAQEQAFIGEVQLVLEQEELQENFPLWQTYRELEELKDELVRCGIDFSSLKDADDGFVEALFQLPQTNAWLATKIDNRMAQIDKKRALKEKKRALQALFTSLGARLETEFAQISPNSFKEELLTLQKQQAILSLANEQGIIFQEEVINRIICKKKDFLEALSEAHQLSAQTPFLEALHMLDIKELFNETSQYGCTAPAKTLREKILEWILVEERIFLPQGGAL